MPLVCVECGDVVPVPDMSEAETREWKANHTAATGHDGWREAQPSDIVED